MASTNVQSEVPSKYTRGYADGPLSLTNALEKRKLERNQPSLQRVLSDIRAAAKEGEKDPMTDMRLNYGYGQRWLEVNEELTTGDVDAFQKAATQLGADLNVTPSKVFETPRKTLISPTPPTREGNAVSQHLWVFAENFKATPYGDVLVYIDYDLATDKPMRMSIENKDFLLQNGLVKVYKRKPQNPA